MLSNLDIVACDRLPFPVVDAVYSDPPWGAGNLKYWRTINGQTDHAVDWSGFLRAFFGHCERHCPNGPWFIETGVRFVDDVLACCNRTDASVLNCRYRGGSKWYPNRLILFGGKFPSLGIPEDDRYGLNLVRWALGDLPSGASVMDPCCGLGTTAKACRVLGLQFFGNELNEKRLAKTRAIWEKP